MLRRFPIVFLLFLSVEAIAQTDPGRIIKGVVRDSATGRPIESVNVFLASTSYGTGSDRDGNYRLTGLPRGPFTLIFSRVGYVLKTVALEIGRTDSIVRNASLSPQLITLGDVEVSGVDALEWHRNYGVFTRILLGEGPNAGECEITNPDVLMFHTDSTSDVLRASASRPIHITNKGLGYDLEVSLSEFHWNTESDYGYFLVYPLFHPLNPADSVEAMRWEENRKKAYDGSLQHFLRSLIQRRIKEEEYVVRKGWLVDLQSGTGKYVYPEEIRLEPVAGSSMWRWTFDDWLSVNRENESSVRVSYLQVEHHGALIDQNGIVEDPLTVRLLGRWAKERVSEMLPFEAMRHPF